MADDGETNDESLEKLVDFLDSDKGRKFVEGQVTAMAEEAYHAFKLVFDLLREPIHDLSFSIHGREVSMRSAVDQLRANVNPYWKEHFTDMVDLSEYRSLHVMRGLALNVSRSFEPIYGKTLDIPRLYQAIEGIFSLQDKVNVRVLKEAQTTLEHILKESGELLQYHTELFEENVVNIGKEIEQYHKRLRIKYQGMTEADQEDETEKLFRKLLGAKPDNDAPAEIKKVPLYKENCIFTDLLGNIVDQLPRYRERTIQKRGKSKLVRKLDDSEIESLAYELEQISHKGYLELIEDPRQFTELIANSIATFYDHHSSLLHRYRSVVSSTERLSGVHFSFDQDLLRKLMPDPEKAIKRMKRLDFLSIRPDDEEVFPRNKVERDYQKARQKLFSHLDDAMHKLASMKNEDLDSRLETAERAIRGAISLREDMDDIMRTEQEKRLKADIRGDNEFYKGVTGLVGSFEAERAPTPTVKYKGVLGKSFDDAKEHIEEVVGIAKYPHLMEVTAPRGNIKSNLLLIGPYGCGKSELARAIGGDKRVIGLYVSVKDILTAYMHESVKNVGRVWDAASELRRNSRDSKPVALIMDEFDAWFQQGKGMNGTADMQQIRTTLQEVMDGVVSYPGVIMVAMTNEPKTIPDAVLRRFKYVDVVGKLNLDERANMMRNFLKRGMAVSPGIKMKDYRAWASQGEMQYAPGDVIGKIADHVHFGLMRDYLSTNPNEAGKLEKYLAKMKRHNEVLSDSDYSHVKRHLRDYKPITKEMVGGAVDHMLKQPPVQKMILAAKETYEAADEIKAGLATLDPDRPTMGFGRDLKRESKLF